MGERRFVFFDVGNTLLFPNRKKMLAPIPEHQHPTLEQWQALERRTKKEFDQNVQSGLVHHRFSGMFHSQLLEGLDLDQLPHDDDDDKVGDRQSLLRTLVANTQNSAHWDQILP